MTLLKDVRLELDRDEKRALGRMNLAARVLSGWFQDPDFCDAGGSPLPLPETGPFPAFEDLARRYGGAERAYVVRKK